MSSDAAALFAWNVTFKLNPPRHVRTIQMGRAMPESLRGFAFWNNEAWHIFSRIQTRTPPQA